jgi:hypothetical protein
MIYLIYCKNFGKCHNVLHSTTIKKKKKIPFLYITETNSKFENFTKCILRKVPVMFSIQLCFVHYLWCNRSLGSLLPFCCYLLDFFQIYSVTTPKNWILNKIYKKNTYGNWSCISGGGVPRNCKVWVQNLVPPKK